MVANAETISEPKLHGKRRRTSLSSAVVNLTFREAGPLFESAYHGASESRSVSGGVAAMEGEGGIAAGAISAAASALTSYYIFGSQAKALSSAFDSAFSSGLNAAVPGPGTAYDVLSAINRALSAASTGGGPLSQYDTLMTRKQFPARAAAAIRHYAATMDHCQCGCGEAN